MIILWGNRPYCVRYTLIVAKWGWHKQKRQHSCAFSTQVKSTVSIVIIDSESLLSKILHIKYSKNFSPRDNVVAVDIHHYICQSTVIMTFRWFIQQVRWWDNLYRDKELYVYRQTLYEGTHFTRSNTLEVLWNGAAFIEYELLWLGVIECKVNTHYIKPIRWKHCKISIHSLIMNCFNKEW